MERLLKLGLFFTRRCAKREAVRLVERVAAESFEFDPTRIVVPPLDGLNVPELRSAMLAVDAELRAGGVGGPLMVEALATVLSVHLIRYITGRHRRPASTDGVLPRRKLHTVTEYIMENLEGSPTPERMAAVAHLSPYHFARQFKATTGLPPHQYVIARRVEQAQHLLRIADQWTLSSLLAPLERIGDHATNIAADSFWRDQATDIRHTYSPKMA
ncbi:MAG TPA: helix-turn-helix domain-containing protein [Chthoniobacterales bacterium]